MAGFATAVDRDVSRLLQTPPLLGDGSQPAVYRIHVIGNSGSGKSTLSRRLASLLNIQYISLDELFWGPGWLESSVDDFQTRVGTLLERYRATGWVVDGNYTHRVSPLVAAERTDCIWLDPPLLLYFPRLVYRTLLRLLRLEPPCAPGCDESLAGVLQPNETSIIWWCFFHHRPLRARGQQLLLQDGGVERGGKVRRLGGWGSEYREWMAELVGMADQTRREGAILVVE